MPNLSLDEFLKFPHCQNVMPGMFCFQKGSSTLLKNLHAGQWNLLQLRKKIKSILDNFLLLCLLDLRFRYKLQIQEDKL